MVLSAIFYYYANYAAPYLRRLWPSHFYGHSGVHFLPWLVLKVVVDTHAPAEAEALRYVRQHTTIPVPRVYASANGFGYNFILMEKLEGQCLPAVWEQLIKQQRDDILLQLKDYIVQLRSLPSPYGRRICSAKGGPVWDLRITCSEHVGPFKDEASFNDALIDYARVFIHPHYLSPIRSRMREDHRIFFTHGDLAPRNIMVKDGRISGIVDWETSGWFPEYWELVKVMWCPSLDEEWEKRTQALFGEEDKRDWMVDKEMSDHFVGPF